MADKIEIRNFNLYYDRFHALKSVKMTFSGRNITALIGPSGCGKSTLLRSINRMNDIIEGVRIDGGILIDGRNIYDSGTDIYELRKKVGMVFQRPNPFAKSVFENIAFGLRVERMRNKNRITEIVEKSLDAVGMWNEMKDRLDTLAVSLPLYHQQLLCIARLLAVEPEVILMDEPCSALDPISTMRIEEMMLELKRDYNIIIVTHNMQQAARVSDQCGYMLLGEMIEFNQTSEMFTNPRDRRTQDYITGRFG